MWMKIALGGVIGLLAGGMLGYFGKCSSGACPLTANPYRGAIIGALIGVLIVMAWAERRPAEQTADNIPHLTTLEQFDEKVLKSPRPVLVDFYSDRCPPCRKLAPTISKLEADYQGKADVFKVNVDEARELARRYEIINIPTAMLFDKGEVVKRWIGVRDESEYRLALDSVVTKQEESSQ